MTFEEAKQVAAEHRAAGTIPAPRGPPPDADEDGLPNDDGNDRNALVCAQTYLRDFQDHPSQTDRSECAWYIDDLSDRDWTTLVVEFGRAHVERGFDCAIPDSSYANLSASDIPV